MDVTLLPLLKQEQSAEEDDMMMREKELKVKMLVVRFIRCFFPKHKLTDFLISTLSLS